MKRLVSLVLINVSLIFTGFSQSVDTAFFPAFQAYSGNPVIKWGDGFLDASWNDPTVLKVNGQYIMYASAAIGFPNGNNKVKIYRMISSDGYTWSLSPATPVVEPASGTYYGGGTETPSVVFFNGQYHMFLTVYPGANVAGDFSISHATSTDGISWVMDTNSILESDSTLDWKEIIVGEPGAIVYHDSLYLFFTAVGTNNNLPVQSIGLIRSSNGTNFGAAIQVVTRPEDVYPAANNWSMLSTPSALAINDSIYLFTDVARIINGTWTQVALHQFKTFGNLSSWYHSNSPIHSMEDFYWTNGSFSSELRSITPLMDDNGRLRIWYAGNNLAEINDTIINGTTFYDTIYHATVDSAGFHADPNYWGIGTSEYQFTNSTVGLDSKINFTPTVIYPNPAADYIIIRSSKKEEWKIINSYGQTIASNQRPNTRINLSQFPNGIYYLISNESITNKRFVILH